MKIIGPHDKGISESIKANLEPQAWDLAEVDSQGLLDYPEHLRQAYVSTIGSLGLHKCVMLKL